MCKGEGVGQKSVLQQTRGYECRRLRTNYGIIFEGLRLSIDVVEAVMVFIIAVIWPWLHSGH